MSFLNPIPSGLLTNPLQGFPIPVAIKPLRNIIGLNSSQSIAGQSNPSGGISSTSTLQSTTIVADAVVRERHEDELTITQHPVETGSVVADHAYKEPAKLELTYGWSLGSSQNTQFDPGFLNKLYQTFIGFQVNVTLLQVNTGKRQYQQMLITNIATESDKENENIMLLVLSLQEILLAITQTLNTNQFPSQSVQATPQQNAAVIPQGNQTLQSAPNFNASAPE